MSLLSLLKDGESRILEAMTAKWKSASGAKKVMWLGIAVFAAYFAYQFKQEWKKLRSQRRKP